MTSVKKLDRWAMLFVGGGATAAAFWLAIQRPPPVGLAVSAAAGWGTINALLRFRATPNAYAMSAAAFSLVAVLVLLMKSRQLGGPVALGFFGTFLFVIGGLSVRSP